MPAPGGGRGSLSRAADGAIRTIAVEVVGLVVTGLWLHLRYRPSAGDAWPGLGFDRTRQWAVLIHRVLAIASAPTLLVALVLVTASAVADRPGFSARLLALPLAVVAALVAGISGVFLPWDLVGLIGVTTGGHRFDGFNWLFTSADEVLLVVIDGREVSPGSLRSVYLVHLAGALALVACVGAAIALGGSGQRRSESGGGPNRPSE